MCGRSGLRGRAVALLAALRPNPFGCLLGCGFAGGIVAGLHSRGANAALLLSGAWEVGRVGGEPGVIVVLLTPPPPPAVGQGIR